MREAAGRVGEAAEPGERAPADAVGIARLDDRVARGADREGVARQGEGEALDVLASSACASTCALSRLARALSIEAMHRDHAQRQQAEAEDDPHLEAGRQPLPARAIRSARRRSCAARPLIAAPISRAFRAGRAFPAGCPRSARVIGRAQRIADLAARGALAAPAFAAIGRRWSSRRNRTNSFTPHGTAPARSTAGLSICFQRSRPAEQTHRIGGPG